MKYQNANSVLPEELIEAIQQYVQGEYLYIPIKDRIESTTPTEYVVELQKRDGHIYTKSLEGVSNKKLADMYNLSESSIRRIIMNQRKKYKTMINRIKDILDNWNVEYKEMKQVYDTAWQVGEGYILKVYEDINMLEKNIKISTILDDMNIPVGKIILAKENTTFARDEQYYYVLSEKLHGNNIVSMKDNSKLAFQMGKIIADLHLAFKECETQDEFWDNSLLAEMTGWVKSVLSDDGWKYIDKFRFEATVSQLEALYEKLPVQLIHRDVHFGNFLFNKGEFSGYIDFDLSQRNIRLFDLCYFMLGLLSEVEKFEITNEEWFRILKDVFEGYQNAIKLLEEEKQVVPYVMKSIELLFVACFLEQEDFKFAENAVKIFEFVDKNADKIVLCINEYCG